MNVIGKNKILEEIVEELVRKIESMRIEVRNMKASKGGSHEGSETNGPQLLNMLNREATL